MPPVNRRIQTATKQRRALAASAVRKLVENPDSGTESLNPPGVNRRVLFQARSRTIENAGLMSFELGLIRP
jgi:plasmid stabilization system protein ParE